METGGSVSGWPADCRNSRTGVCGSDGGSREAMNWGGGLRIGGGAWPTSFVKAAAEGQFPGGASDVNRALSETP
jgi:hypothetical protein